MYKVIKYINENITNKVSLDDLSKEFGYSKWHLCRKFKQFTGTSFVSYVNDKKISLAALEILNGEKIIDVAMKYGYESVGGFNKAFLTKYGLSPKTLKKESIKSYIEYQKRRDTMYKLTDRVDELREEAVNQKTLSEKVQYIRRFLFRLGEVESEKGTSNTLITAHSLCKVIRESPAYILDKELIVGYNFGDDGWTGDFKIPDSEEARDNLRSAGFAERDIAFYFENKKTSKYTIIPAEQKTEQEEQLEKEWAAIGKCMTSNHTIVGYEEVLKYGFDGLYKRVCRYEEKNGPSDLYEAAKMICRAAMEFGEKYSAEAVRLAEHAEEGRREELLGIAEICKNVPRYPAKSFHEAVQSLWFAHIINTWEDTINANSLGRLDQILYPYYKKDIEEGNITEDDAFELICCLWIKLYRDYDVQQSCVGGCDRNGNEAVNTLSYMMLDATEELDFIRCLSVRFSQNTDRVFLKRALEVVGHVQKGVPFFFNDDVMIPALQYGGVSLEDARDYTQLGCVETAIPGKCNPHAVTGETNLLKALEYGLSAGKSMMNEDFTPGLKTDAPETLDTYEKLESVVKKQIYHILDVTCRRIVKETHAATWNYPRPYKSLLTEGCLEKNLDFNNHGAKYDYYQVMLGGVPNLADSLLVIKELVYGQKKYTLDEVIYQMENDFPNELMRLEFMNKVPKFGNDINEVDEIAVAMVEYACDVLGELSQKYGYNFHAQPFTYLWMVDHGRFVAATPDGRRRGEVIAYSASPMQGRDFNGLTSLLNSIAKLPTKRTPGTTSAIVEVDPMLYTDRNIDYFVDVLLAAGKNGLENVQFNTVDAETLLDAQKHPEKHKNLAVRVSGFSQKFNLLERELQDHIIGRTKHKCL